MLFIKSKPKNELSSLPNINYQDNFNSKDYKIKKPSWEILLK